MTLYFSLNPDSLQLIKGESSLFFFLIFLGIVLISVSVYDVLKFKLILRNMLSLFVGLIFIIFAYEAYWTKFYILTAKDHKIYLQYFYPVRTVKIDLRNIKSFDRIAKGKEKYNFLITTRDGKVFTSGGLVEVALNKNENILKQYMIKELGYSRH